VYSDGSGLASKLAAQLSGMVVTVGNGSTVKQVAERQWSLDFTSPDQNQELLDELAQAGFQPTDTLYCCGLAGSGTGARPEDVQERLNGSFFIPTFIVRALGRLGE